jgi:hypothetical protein
MRESARAKTAFYTPRGKKQFRSMPMGAKNAHPAFVAMVTNFEDTWDKLYCDRDENLYMVDNWKKQHDNKIQHTHTSKPRYTHTSRPGLAVIVDDIILFAKTAAIHLSYFKCVIEVLKHYRVTLKLRKTRFFPKRAEFVGFDIMKEGNTPAESKYDAIEKLARPTLFSNLRMLTGLLGFYRAWIALFEV